MTDEEHKAEGLDESIEDLEAPAAAQDDVAGGKTVCATPTCTGASSVSTFCVRPTCDNTSASCQLATSALVYKMA